MIVFWILASFVALFVAAGGFVVYQWGPLLSIVMGIITIVILRGLLSWVRRSLVLREKIADESTQERRTLETNRYIFWRRASVIGALGLLYFGGAYTQFGLGFFDALIALVSIMGQGLLLVVQLGALFLANFALFFGPFLLFARLGRETYRPGDANYEVKIADVRGQKSAVNEMQRILRLIEQGRSYVKAGGKRERGVLMVGPPGTGKTMLAKAIASELHTPIIVSSGSAYSGMFMGMDLVAVFMTVRAAKKLAKRWGGCIIFIDEFDALGQSRGGMGGGGMGGLGGMMGGFRMGLNMLLVQMDGMDNAGFFKKGFRRFVNITLDGLFVPREIRFNGTRIALRIPQLKPPRYNLFFVGATNRPSVLDEAVTRPGRFGRTITFRMPTREDRKDIAELYFSRKAHDPELDTPSRREEFARITEGYSPAMIEQALSLALMYAFEDDRPYFNWQDMRESMGNIEAGLVQPVEYTERDKIAVARHELGHAVAARFFLPEHAHVRLSIKMRADGSLGHHRAIQEQEEFIRFRSQLAANVRHGLGAIAAERVFYGENSNGVVSDLSSSTRQACHMVGIVGMGGEHLPYEIARKAVNIGQTLISTLELGGSPLLDGGSPFAAALQNPLSRRTVAQVLGAAYIDCWRLMYVNREAIDMAVEALIAQGELVGDEIQGLLDSVGLRFPTESDPYPEDMPLVPLSAAEELGRPGADGRAALEGARSA